MKLIVQIFKVTGIACWKKIVVSLCITSLFMSCSSDSAIDKEEISIHDKLEFCVSINLPISTKSTRSSTNENGNTGDEVTGEDNENAVNRAFIYFCVGDFVKLTLEANEYKETSTGYDLKANLNLDDLQDIAGEKISIIVLANPVKLNNQNLSSKGPDKAHFTVSEIENSPIGDFGSNGKILPMINKDLLLLDFSDIAKTEKPQKILDALGEKLQKVGNTYKLGTIDMERCVARVEYKDAERTNNSLPSSEYTYKIGNSNVYIKLDHLQIFNVNTQSYLIRHTSSGTSKWATGDPTLFGKENAGTDYTWIAGYDWSRSGESFNKGTSYLNVLSVDEEEWTVNGDDGIIEINTLKERLKADNDNFHPWCYITENIIPSIEMMDDNGLIKYATGIACSFVVLDKDGNNDLIYSSSEDKYPSDIKNGDKSGDITITMNDNGGVYQDVSPINGKYYLTYYGFIKHNDPQGLEEEEIAPMNYSIVRNNTYQLSISKIGTLPQPKEPKTMFLKIDVFVRPWTVRKNPMYM